jgi:hypothetical protein
MTEPYSPVLDLGVSPAAVKPNAAEFCCNVTPPIPGSKLNGVALAALIATCSAIPSYARSFCEPDGGADAVDTSTPVNPAFLTEMRRIGVKVIIRYYDHEDETITGKTLRRKERDLIVGAGFQFMTVFQHHNDQFGSFTPQRGRADGERSLTLAKENGEVPGATLFFGVDGPWGTKPSEIQAIESYFRSIASRFDSSGYSVGIYGSGLVCSHLMSLKLASHCWLANAKGWPNYQPFALSGGWTLAQFPPEKCAGRFVDFSIINRVAPVPIVLNAGGVPVADQAANGLQ